ncbi:MAG: PD-(D/E)XK motif protein [Candidatus Nanopelagicales bacterium]
MDLEKIWSDIESKAPPGPGIVIRRIMPDGQRDLSVGTSFPNGHRMLILKVDNETIGASDNLPSSRAVQTVVVPDGDNKVDVRIELLAQDARDVFTVFIANVAAATLEADTDAAAVQVLIERFHYWRRLLSGEATEGLGADGAQGLWGELWVMRHLLFPIWGSKVVASWTGPSKDDVDFRLGMSTAEVKTLRGDLPAVARIASERQLDPASGINLALIALMVDRHRHGTGESLPEMVDACLDLVKGADKTQLENLLIEWGYLKIHKESYAETRYSIREVRAFDVQPSFPRITESMLPDGVGKVTYSLSLDACQAWRIKPDELGALLPCLPPD